MLDFVEWFEDVNIILEGKYEMQAFNCESWRHYYHEGYSPAAAVEKEMAAIAEAAR